MKHIEIGKKAPEFILEDIHENQVKLSDYKGKKVLLSWHPLAWTGVCTDQMRALEANHERFEKLNTVALGLSVDPVPGKLAWASVLRIKNTPLLSDFWPHGKAAKDYGIFLEDMGISERANVIIDEEGIVRWMKIYPIAQLPDIEEVFKKLEEI
ncbi:MAG: peroxiredoxin [Clostridia bacterium]|jgi:peroxiredoxin|nr:peroxiredoxin [Clostridia bacterium]NLF37486.1 peroxiredoxin [Clostridiaceae bacterium]MDD3093130.1 peroxiredoxin [Clostridia bacterium]MDD3972842.1 peroxiredoxin [Clostridia bacterium]MDD4544160.1 peroxiredoxin [Clostridia bacterium]